MRLLLRYYYTSVAGMVQKAKDAEVDTAFQMEMARSIVGKELGWLCVAVHDAHWTAMYREPMTCAVASSSSNRFRCL